MKTNYLFTSLLAGAALFASSCSTSRLANNSAIQDDVYNSLAQAREYKEAPVAQNATSSTETANADDYYGTSDPYYDMDYATRINRFYYASPWRTYYDNYYGFYHPGYYNNAYNYSFYGVPYDIYAYRWGSPFYYSTYMWDNYYWGYNFYNPLSLWRYYGMPYYSNYWGPYSYYTNVPYYGTIRGTGANYRARPQRGNENGITRGTSYTGGTQAINGTSATRSRAEQYNPSRGSSGTARTNSSGTASRPASSGNDSRPTRGSNDNPQRSTYTPPAQSTPPPASSGGGSRAESGSSSSGGGRPTRGGGR